MSFILNAFGYLLSLILVFHILVVPGYAFLRLIGFKSRHKMAFFIATITLSLVLVSYFAWFLSLFSLFTRTYIMIFLSTTGIYVIIHEFNNIKRKIQESVTPFALRNHVPFNKICQYDIILILLLGVLLGLLFIITATSPITTWDAVVSWDAWAMDWARLSTLNNHSFGIYGQLMPIIHGTIYKILGVNDLPSIPMFVLHSTGSLYAFVTVLSIGLMVYRNKAPLYPALLVVFASQGFVWLITSGYADIYLVMFVTGGIALWYEALYDDVDCKGNRFIPSALSFSGALFVKPSALLWLPLLAIATLVIREGTVKNSESRHSFILRHGRKFFQKDLFFILVLPVLIVLPFYLLQVGLDLINQLVVKEPVYRVFMFVDSIYGAREIGHNYELSTGSIFVGVKLAIFEEYWPYGVSLMKIVPVSIICVCILYLFVVGCIVNPALGVLGSGCIVLWSMWAVSAKYDTRNLMASLPVFGVLVAIGVERTLINGGIFCNFCKNGLLWRVARKLSLTLLVACFFLLALRVLTVTFFAGRDVLRWTGLRVACTLHPVDRRQVLWFNKEKVLLDELTDDGLLEEFRYIYACDEFFRFVPNGVYLKQKLWVLPDPLRDMWVICAGTAVPDGWAVVVKTDAYWACVGESHPLTRRADNANE